MSLAPGDNESGGKRKKAPTRKGDQHLRTAMAESAWATWRTATRPGARFRRLARRFGKGNENKAAVAVAHTRLRIAWAVMKYDGGYADATDYDERRDQRNREHLVRYSTPWPGSASRSPWPRPVTAARHRHRPPARHNPGPGRLTLTARRRRATRAGSAGAAARLAGVSKFRHRVSSQAWVSVSLCAMFSRW